MIPVTQTEIGVDNPRANCLMSSVASILEVAIDSLPDLQEHEQRGLHWYGVLRDAVVPFGLVPLVYDQHSPDFPPIAPLGYHIACGQSPRSDHDHAVVALNGKVVHDPHPTHAGLRDGKITWWILLLPKAQ